MTAIDNFKRYYLTFDQNPVDELDGIYSGDVVFSDPVHQINGLASVKEYFSSMCGNLIHCHFEFTEETIEDDRAWFKWNMHFQHPQLKRGESILVSGVTRIAYDPSINRVTAHEDFYDMGAMLYEHTPIFGRCVRWLKRRISGTS